jgi:hypothetical protein
MASPESWTRREELGELLDELDRLRRFTRAVRHGYWLPLVLLGLLMIGATPLYFRPSSQAVLGASRVVFKPRPGASGSGFVPPCHVVNGVVFTPCKSATITAGATYFPSGVTTTSPRAIAVYWLIALPLAYVVVAVWAHRRAIRRGVSTPMLAYALTGVVLVVLLVLSGLLAGAWTSAGRLSSIGSRGLTALFVIALGLLVLAYRERSGTMWAISGVFLGYSILINLYDLNNFIIRFGIDVGPEIGVFIGGVFILLAGLAFAAKPEPRL